MKDIFRKTLSLLACMVLVGQTLLASVVTAVEVGDGYLNEEGTTLEEDVVTEDLAEDSDVKVLAVEKVQDFGEVKFSDDELKVLNVAENLDDVETATTTTSNVDFDNKNEVKGIMSLNVCKGKDWTDVGKILKDYLRDRGIRVHYQNGKIVVYYDNVGEEGKETKEKYVQALIDYILVDGNVDEGNMSEEMSLWNTFGNKYELDIGTVTQLIDLFLRNESRFSVNGECRIKVEFGDMNNGTEEESCMEKDAVIDDLDKIISSYLDEYSVDVSSDEEIVINYNQEGSLIKYVVALIDYLLESGNIDENDTRTEMGLWKMIGEKYRLSIQTVTELIDLLLQGENTFTVKEKNKDCDSYDIMVRFGGSQDEGGNTQTYTCEASQSSNSDNLGKLTDILNEDETVLANNLSLRATGYNLYLLADDSVNLNISMVTSLINYLLTNEASDNDEWGFLWEAMSEANLEPNISTVADLIDILLGNQPLKAGSKVTIRTDGGCFYLIVVENNGNSGGDDSAQVCDAETLNTAMNIIKEAIDEEIKNISRIETSIENNRLVFLIDSDKNPQNLNLIQYVELLIKYLLGDETVAFWPKLSNFDLDINYVTRLISVNLKLPLGEKIYKKDVMFNGCQFNFQLEFRTVNNDSNGDNNSNGNNNSSYSGGGSSGRGGSSSSSRGDDEDITLGGEVSDSEKVCSIEGSIYSDEENQAYIWACKKGIVAADNIMDANLTNPITRAELDKMLSVYATKLLGMNHVIEEEVTYPDVNDSLGDLAYYIQEGYKLQIMGIHANGAPLSKFLPYSLVTRGEFGTVFSRILYGNGNNIDGNNYYEKHLQLLKNANILQNTDHSLMELRGWILLMLYRSQKVKESNGSLELEEVSSITAG